MSYQQPFTNNNNTGYGGNNNNYGNTQGQNNQGYGNTQGYGGNNNNFGNSNFNQMQQQQPILPGGNRQNFNNTNNQYGGGELNNGGGIGYQQPFQVSGNNWNNNSSQQMNTSGYQQPFNVSNNSQLPGMQHNRGGPQMLDANNEIKLPGGGNAPPVNLQFNDLSATQMSHLRQIQTFLLTNSFTLEKILGEPPFSLPSYQDYLSPQLFEALGRHCRTEPFPIDQMKDLQMKLRNPLQPNPEQLQISVLKRLLQQSGAKASTDPIASDVFRYKWQDLRDLMSSLNKKTAEQMFDELQIGKEGDEQVVEKDVLIQKCLEAQMKREDIDLLITSITTKEGRISLNKLDEELQKPSEVEQPKSIAMSSEKAREILDGIFELLKRYISYNEVNLFDWFDDMEQGDGYFNREELTNALAKCKFKVLGPEHEERVLAVFHIYDRAHTLRFDFQQLLYDFYAWCNTKRIVDPMNKMFKVCDLVRQFMKARKQISLCNTFLTDFYLSDKYQVREQIKNLDKIYFNTQDFMHQIKVMNIKDLENYAFSQSFVLSIMDMKTQQIDYLKFCDLIGFEQPQKSNKEQARKIFYRTLLKDLQGNMQTLTNKFVRDDTQLSNRCHLSVFMNTIVMFSQQLVGEPEVIRQVANDFMIPGEAFQIEYPKFLRKIESEIDKQNQIIRIYKSFNQLLQFQESTDLYGAIFAKYDSNNGERKFSEEQLKKIFIEQLGVQNETADKDAKYFLQEFDSGPKKTYFIRYVDLEQEFTEFINNEKRQGRIKSLTGLPTILRIIKKYSDQTGQNLRTIFNKTKLGESDYMKQFEVSKILTKIQQETRSHLDDASIPLFINAISITVSNPVLNSSPQKKERYENIREISYSLLQQLYNKTFGFKDNDEAHFNSQQVENLFLHIAKMIISHTKIPTVKFNMREVFPFPQSSSADFCAILNQEPFMCQKIFPAVIIEELAKKYQSGFQRVDTSNFIMDMEDKVRKMKEKDIIYGELQKNILKKNSTIERVFEEAMPDFKRFQLDQFQPEMFYKLMIYLEIGTISVQQIKDMLTNFQEPDKDGKFSVSEFIKDYKKNCNVDPAVARKGKKNYQNREEILKRIAYIIENRFIQNFGQLLADMFPRDSPQLPRDQFYRFIDSFQTGLGEADIQELMRGYTIKGSMIDVERFKDDLNFLITDPLYKVELNSKLGAALGARVVDPLDEQDANASKMKQVRVDPKVQAKFQQVAREINCGLFVRAKTIGQWFSQVGGKTYKDVLTVSEFISGLQMLDALQIFDKAEQLIQSYYENLVAKQVKMLGFDQPNLLITNLEILLKRDYPVSTADIMIEEILMDIVYHLFDKQIPLQDKFDQFDKTKEMKISKSEFTSTFLDTYLQLQPNPKTGTFGLSTNEKNLLVSKYAPNQSTLVFFYQAFITDLQNKSRDCNNIKLFMTQQDIDSYNQAHINNAQEDEPLHVAQDNIAVPDRIDMPAQSSKNTHITELTAQKLTLKSLQLASFLFEDLMMSTYQLGQSVEEYFYGYAKYSQGEFIVDREQFQRALSDLGVEWRGNADRVRSLFDQVDIASNRRNANYISISDIAQAILFNATSTVDDKLSDFLMRICRLLKDTKQDLSLQEILNNLNSRRDETCMSPLFKSTLLALIDPQRKFSLLTESQITQLIHRYRIEPVHKGASDFRVNFGKFYKDIQLCAKGITVNMAWGIRLANNIVKAKIIREYPTFDQLFMKYSRMKDIMAYEEFSMCMKDMRLNEEHTDEEFQNFYNYVQSGSAQGGGPQQNNFNRVAHQQLKAAITRFAYSCKYPSHNYVLILVNGTDLIEQLLETILTETKKNNLSAQTVSISFNEFDDLKQMVVTYQNFKNAIISKLNVQNLSEIDFMFLAKRYKRASNQASQDIESQMIMYPNFVQDYRKFEKEGFQAMNNPIKQANQSTTQQQRDVNPQTSPLDAKPRPQSQASVAFYKKVNEVFTKNQRINQLCDALSLKDRAAQRGYLIIQTIVQVFSDLGAKFDQTHIKNLVEPLPMESIDNSYNYLVLIELAFSKQRAIDTYNKLTKAAQSGMLNSANQPQRVITRMRPDLKDDIEVKLSHLTDWIHQVSKASQILDQNQFLKVFGEVDIYINLEDRQMLQQIFNVLKVQQTQALHFPAFLNHFNISNVTSRVISALQKAIVEQNIRVADEDTGSTLFPSHKDTVSLQDFSKFLESQNIQLPGFSQRDVNEAFSQICERKDYIDKLRLIRILKNERRFVRANIQQVAPFIVGEFINHILNNKIDLFKIVTARSKTLKVELFMSLLQRINYTTSNPKDMPALIKYFAEGDNVAADPRFVSIDKILEELRKKDPEYALETTIMNQAAAQLGAKIPPTQALKQQQQQPQVKLTPVQQAQSKLSHFTQRVKDLLMKVNQELKRLGLSSTDLFSKIDLNGTSSIEKQEFLTFFTSTLALKGLTQDDLDLLFDALDTNRDQLLSINEFCLCLEGIQKDFEHKLRTFDPELEKALMGEIEQLFNFFDTNKDEQVTAAEMEQAMRSQNPWVTKAEVEAMVKKADTNNNKTIDRKEFMQIMLPQMKAEIITREQNLDDLRRLFKEFDLDQSNYLQKNEFREALIRLGIVLSDVQIDDLMKEIDIDGNNLIDIDEFIAFLAIADQVRFQNPQNKAVLIKIKHARKLQPMDFYNSFKNLPQSFQPSITQEPMEKRYLNTPSHNLYPQFDPKSLTYRSLSHLEDYGKLPPKSFLSVHAPPQQTSAELTIEDLTGIPLPKKEDFDWTKITNREVRVMLVDARSQEIISNVFFASVVWKQEAPQRWQVSATEIQQSARSFVVRGDNVVTREVHLVFELVMHVKMNEDSEAQQICCSWGSIPVNQLDKQAKIKVPLKGGRVLQEMKISSDQIYQEKRGFEFLRKLTAASDEPLLTVSIKPFVKLTEQQQVYIAMLPNNVIVNKKLLSFAAIFRLFAFKRLTKTQQQMLAPSGNFAIAQFRKIFDNPDVNLILADSWEHYETTMAPKGQFTTDELLVAMEQFLVQTYAIIYCEDFHFDHVYPTRAPHSIESDTFLQREILMKQQLAPQKYKKLAVKAASLNKENEMQGANQYEDYKPFNIAEMEISIVGVTNNIEARQDELTKMYQQMGLLI